jgi:transmembrane sensor
MKKFDAKDLISKYNQGSATPEEILLVQQWFLEDLESNTYLPSRERIEEADRRIKENLMRHVGAQTADVKTMRLWPRIAVAASLLILLSAAMYFALRKPATHQQLADVKIINDVAPGGNKAILTLGNGKQIILTGARNGKLAVQGNTDITKTADGQVVYNSNQAGSPLDKTVGVEYNTIATPRGGQYHLTLSVRWKLPAKLILKWPITRPNLSMC